MKKITVNVKDKSASAFLEKNLLKLTKSTSNNFAERQTTESVNPYYLLKDEIYFKKNQDINVGDYVIIELLDISENSRKTLINTYTYKVSYYDDIAIKLTLEDFKIDFTEEN